MFDFGNTSGAEKKYSSIEDQKIAYKNAFYTTSLVRCRYSRIQSGYVEALLYGLRTGRDGDGQQKRWTVRQEGLGVKRRPQLLQRSGQHRSDEVITGQQVNNTGQRHSARVTDDDITCWR